MHPVNLRRSATSAFALSALLVFLGGCATEEGNTELSRFSSCDELEGWIQTSALQRVDFIDDPFRPGFWGGDGEVMLEAGALPERMNVAADEAQGASVSGDSGNRSWSTTNVQEEGVDEADFVKNDGDHIFILDQSALTILDAWPAEALNQIARLEIEGAPSSLYFDAVDTVVVFSNIWTGRPAPESGALGFPSDVGWDPVMKVTVVDVADRSSPEVLRELYFDGQLRSSRRIGDRLHVVLTNDLEDFQGGLSSVDPFGPLEAARAAVRSSTADQWMPVLQDNVRVDGGWGTTQGPLCECTDVYRPNNRTNMVFTGVMTIDLSDHSAPVQTAGALTSVDTVYASSDALYLAMTEYSYGPFRSMDNSIDTRLHKFELDDGEGRVTYTASGLVKGALLNSFSLGEHEGTLRVATSRVEGDEGLGSSVYMLQQDGAALEVVGSITEIAPGEEIYSVRYDGDRGYVVTFEQIDPLFTLDLSDPENPFIVGELEVTGFSNYLHLVGDEHLLAVGEEWAPTGFQFLGMQISLFDIGDFASPQLQDREILDSDAWTEAQYDHHAFTYYEEAEVLALPVTRWSDADGQQQSGLNLYRIDRDEGILDVGEVNHTPYMDQEAAWWGSCSQVRRSIFIEDYVFAVSNHGVQVVQLDSPEVDISGVVLGDPGCANNFAFGGGREMGI